MLVKVKETWARNTKTGNVGRLVKIVKQTDGEIKAVVNPIMQFNKDVYWENFEVYEEEVLKRA